MTLPASYFDTLYAVSDDPWGFRSRWYEERKYALTLAALPQKEYARAVEIGCSVGVLTSMLARRCRELVAIDPSSSALETASQSVPSNVELVLGAAPDDWPAGSYDLVVLSEVGYYLSAADLERLLELTRRDLVPGGTVLACHWRHPVVDYPLSGDEVHRALARWPRLSRVEEEDFLLEVFLPDGLTSVARTEGLV